MINDDQPQYDPNLDANQNALITDEEVQKHAVNPAKRFVANLGVAAGIGAGVLGGMVGTASAEEGPSPQPSMSAEAQPGTTGETPAASPEESTAPAEPTPEASESASPEPDPSETPSEEPTTDPTPDTFPGDTGEEEGGEVITVPGGGATAEKSPFLPENTPVLPLPPGAETPDPTVDHTKSLPNTGPATPVDIIPLAGAGTALVITGAAAAAAGRKRPEDA